MKTTLLIFGITLLFLALPTNALASTIYIDGTLGGNCTGTYSINNRACSGTDGNAYNTVSGGVGAASAGDTILLRAGTYSLSSSVSVNFNSSLTTTIQAYNSETVTLSKTVIAGAIFNLGNAAKNITFKDLHFTGLPYVVITGWTNYSGNVWQATSNSSTQIRFDTTNGTSVASIALVNSANKYFYSAGTMYVYSVGDPSTTYTSPGINIADNFDAIGIGNPSWTLPGNLITVDHCTFNDFAHAGVKGTWKWWVKNSEFNNIGTDGNDHDIYPNGVQTVGNEMIFEYNYFGYSPGAGLHFYTAPAYAIVRYNVFNGLSGSNRGNYGVLLGGSHIKIYNNTFYGYGSLGGIDIYKNTSQNNEIKNNLFSNNTSDLSIDYGGSSFPTNITVSSNYFGSGTKCTGCVDNTGSGGPDYTSLDDTPPNVSSDSPWTKFTYSFNKATTGSTNITLLNACGGGASPSSGTWYFDDISIVPSGGGAEKVVNGGMEGTYSNGLAPNWTKGGSGSTWTQSTTIVHSGSSAQKVVMGGGCGERIEQSMSLTAGDYILTGWAKRDNGTGTLPIYIAGGNTSFTIGRIAPAFLGTLPYSVALDFKVDSSDIDASTLINGATNLGSDFQMGFDSAATSWPISTINQNYFGNGWDYGAFIYNNDTTAPATIDNTDTSVHTSAVTITLTCSDSGSGCANTYYTTDGSTPTSLSYSGASAVFNRSGVFTIKYYSVDNAGNIEAVKTATNVVRVNIITPTVQVPARPITPGKSVSSGRSTNCPFDYMYCIDVGPHQQNNASFHGYGDRSPGVYMYINKDATNDDLHIEISNPAIDTLTVPLPWSQCLNAVSEIVEIKSLSAYNGAPISTLNQPATITLPYDNEKVKHIPLSQLRIAYFNPSINRWIVLRNNTIVDTTQNRISNTTKFISTYFTVVNQESCAGNHATLVEPELNPVPVPTQKTESLKPTFPAKEKETETVKKKCILFFCW